jgi:Family of unknown function (DUF5431)
MSDQHQYGLLPCIMQGGVNHETAAKRPYLVRIDSVSHAADIHLPDPDSFMRGSTKGWRQGGRCGSGLRIQR